MTRRRTRWTILVSRPPRWSGRACFRSTARSMAAIGSRSRGRSGSMPCAERFTAFLAGEVDALIDVIEPGGGADLRRSVAGPLSVSAMARALGMEDTDPEVALGWYAAIVADVTAITSGRPASGDGSEASDVARQRRGRARPRPCRVAGRRRGSGSLRAHAGAGRLECRCAALRRHRDDGGDDRERAPSPARASRAARARRGRPPTRRKCDRGIPEARAGGSSRRPLRHP